MVTTIAAISIVCALVVFVVGMGASLWEAGRITAELYRLRRDADEMASFQQRLASHYRYESNADGSVDAVLIRPEQ